MESSQINVCFDSLDVVLYFIKICSFANYFTLIMKKLRNKNMCNLVKRFNVLVVLVLPKRLNYKYVKDFKYGQTKTAFEARVSSRRVLLFFPLRNFEYVNLTI